MSTISPLLTIVIPAYNSQDYLGRCLDSVIRDESQVEVLVVDDGSSDATAQIGQDYARQHPCVRLISQENKGHGGAVNTGIANAHGTWIKIVDSDDALDPKALSEVLDNLSSWRDGDIQPDLVISNFVYVREGKFSRRHRVRYSKLLPQKRIGTWQDVGSFRSDQYLLMHSLIYRTQVLRESGLVLPEHTFYVDYLYAYTPLPSVKTLTYVDVDLYLYTIGREGQSVAEDILISRLDQMERVNRAMLKVTPYEGEVNSALAKYMVHIYTICSVVVTTMALQSKQPDLLHMKDQLWQDIKSQRPDVYKRMRRTALGRTIAICGVTGSRLPVRIYKVARRVLALN